MGVLHGATQQMSLLCPSPSSHQQAGPSPAWDLPCRRLKAALAAAGPALVRHSYETSIWPKPTSAPCSPMAGGSSRPSPTPETQLPAHGPRHGAGRSWYTRHIQPHTRAGGHPVPFPVSHQHTAAALLFPNRVQREEATCQQGCCLQTAQRAPRAVHDSTAILSCPCPAQPGPSGQADVQSLVHDLLLAKGRVHGGMGLPGPQNCPGCIQRQQSILGTPWLAPGHGMQDVLACQQPALVLETSCFQSCVSREPSPAPGHGEITAIRKQLASGG